MAEIKKRGLFGGYETIGEQMSRERRERLYGSKPAVRFSPTLAGDAAARFFRRSQEWAQEVHNRAVADAHAFNMEQARKRRP